MKKSLLWVVVLLLSISMIAAFSFVGCKAEEAPTAEEEAEEEESGGEVEGEVVEEEPAPQIVVTYIGSAGFILESQNKKIMIDAPFNSSFISAFEAIPGYAEGIESKIANAEVPFDDIDLFLMTHEHEDHLDPQLLGQCFSKNLDAKLVTTQGVYDILEDKVDNFADLKDRIIVNELGSYESIETTIDGFNLKVSDAEHAGLMHVHNFEFNLDGIEIAYIREQNKYEKTKDIDILFLNTLINLLEPKHIFLCHIFDRNTRPSMLEQTQDLPDVTFMTEPMETATVTKENDEIIVTINQ